MPVLALSAGHKAHHPSIASILPFMGSDPDCVVCMQRFGRIVQIYVTGIMLVTMGTALTVEYTTVGGLFSQIIPSTAIPIVIIIGVVSSVYTAYGGLYVSIITDQIQVT